ncbi:hypothetical protein [Archangium violaceum]|uniref:hypothetical protein n=1 Tax=Archangium violaceum TaxID=83451 RepID=UPI0036DA8A39
MKKGAVKSSEREYAKGWSVESRKHFNFFGLYYRVRAGNHIFPCRSVLDIIHKDISEPPSVSKPYDLLIIMMNPGSSLTRDEMSAGFVLNDWMRSTQRSMANRNSKQHGSLITNKSDISSLESWLSVPKPDNVQGSICKLLLNEGIQRARVLNLIDIRHPDSKAVPAIYTLAKVSGFDECSVFAPGRAEDLKRLIEPLKDGGQKARAFVVAHGSLGALEHLAKESRTALAKSNITIALLQEKSQGQVMYPGRKSPEQWVKPLTNQLRRFMAERRVMAAVTRLVRRRRRTS